jgi:hypothetical protein
VRLSCCTHPCAASPPLLLRRRRPRPPGTEDEGRADDSLGVCAPPGRVQRVSPLALFSQ